MTVATPATEHRASRVSINDRKLFRGTAAEVHSWQDNASILASIGCNFTVESHKPTVDGREYNESRLWLRSDNRDHLGTFGNRRKVIQPSDFITYFRDFCDKSEKAIGLDVVGTPDDGKTFYMASKLIDSNLQGLMDANYGGGLQVRRDLSRDDRTDVWLIITDYYGESSAPKAIILFNELVCYNGMTYRSESKLAGLTHLRQQHSEDVAAVLRDAISQCEVYARIKNKLIQTPVTTEFAHNCIRAFYRNPADPDSTSRKVNRLLDIYDNRLIGGDLDTRRGTAWGVLQAVTQSTTHEHVGDGRAAQGRAFRSLLDGPRANESRRFTEHLLAALAA